MTYVNEQALTGIIRLDDDTVRLVFNNDVTADAFVDAVLDARPDLGDPLRIEAHPFNAEPAPGRYPIADRLIFDTPWRDHLDALGASRIWGEENVTVDSPTQITVRYPAGTSAPSDAADGGAGFVLPMGPGVSSAMLTYVVEVPDTFDPVKGGKLPGLFGGNAPTGGADALEGWTTRDMWREAGELEAYVYAPNSIGDYGESVGRGMAALQPGANRITQEIYLNDPGCANGLLRMWVNDQPMMQAENLIFRTRATVTIDGLIFSTFFGGNGPDWRTPVDQYLVFRDFVFRCEQ